MEEYALAVAVVVASAAEAAVAASSAGVVDGGGSEVVALEAQAAGLCLLVRAHPEAEGLLEHRYEVGLSVRKTP